MTLRFAGEPILEETIDKILKELTTYGLTESTPENAQ